MSDSPEDFRGASRPAQRAARTGVISWQLFQKILRLIAELRGPKFIPILIGLLVAAMFASVPLTSPLADLKVTRIYFIRHAEVDFKNPDKPLSASGRERAAALVEHFKNVKLTHVYASHTDRTRDTVALIAKSYGLNVKQFPTPGSVLKGKFVTNRTGGKAAIKPLLEALRAVPEGSTVLVAANSGNLFAVMSGLGVRTALKENPCATHEQTCLPCSNKSCFPGKEFHNIWLVTLGPQGAMLKTSHYGKLSAQ